MQLREFRQFVAEALRRSPFLTSYLDSLIVTTHVQETVSLDR